MTARKADTIDTETCSCPRALGRNLTAGSLNDKDSGTVRQSETGRGGVGGGGVGVRGGGQTPILY